MSDWKEYVLTVKVVGMDTAEVEEVLKSIDVEPMMGVEWSDDPRKSLSFAVEGDDGLGGVSALWDSIREALKEKNEKAGVNYDLQVWHCEWVPSMILGGMG